MQTEIHHACGHTRTVDLPPDHDFSNAIAEEEKHDCPRCNADPQPHEADQHD